MRALFLLLLASAVLAGENTMPGMRVHYERRQTTGTVEVALDFGAAGNTTARVTVVGQRWVTSRTRIVCMPTAKLTAQRQEGAEDAAVEGLSVAVANLVSGVGFDVLGAAPQRTSGSYLIDCVGA